MLLLKFKGFKMTKLLQVAIVAALILGCSAKEPNSSSERNLSGKEYSFRILPVKVEETPDNWLFKDKFLETPFISISDNNETIVGVLYMPHGLNKVMGEVNIIYEKDENIFGNFPITDCESGRTELNTEVKLKPETHTIFGSQCVKVKI